MNDKREVRVLIFREGEAMVAQGIDVNVAAQADTTRRALKAFVLSLLTQAALDLQSGEKPLTGLSEAPQPYRDEWERSKLRIDFDEELPRGWARARGLSAPAELPKFVVRTA